MQQPESTPSTLTAPPTASPALLAGIASDPASASVPGRQAAAQPPDRVPRWLERLELSLRVILRIFIGLFVCFLPWLGQIVVHFPLVLIFLPGARMLWDQNPIFQLFPALGDFATLGAVRGIVSGLGLLNIWIAFQDAIRHWDG
jgi:hypothetical protein